MSEGLERLSNNTNYLYTKEKMFIRENRPKMCRKK